MQNDNPLFLSTLHQPFIGVFGAVINPYGSTLLMEHLGLDQTVYATFVIDIFARRIAAVRDLHANPFHVTARRISTSMQTQFVLDAL